jgi:hypothetical protein
MPWANRQRVVICLYATVLIWLPVLTGCAAARGAGYRYYRFDRDDLVVPPGASKRLTQPAVIALKHSGGGKTRPVACGLTIHDFAIRWRGSTARISVQLASMKKAADLTMKPPPSFRQFEAELWKLEERGCIASGMAGAIAGRVIEHLALPSLAGYYLRYGYYMQTGYVDLTPAFRLKVVTPIVRNGSQILNAETILGWETAYYAISARPNGGGVGLALSSIEATIDGKTSQKTAPDYSYIRHPEDVSHYRLFFLAASGRMRRNITLMGDRSTARLDQITRETGSEDTDLCAAARTKPAFCMRFPTGTSLSPELTVEANGRTSYLPLGATAGDLLQTLADGKPRVADLRITRMFDGVSVPVNFDRNKDDVFQLVLVGGGRVQW